MIPLAKLTIITYSTKSGREYFTEWFESLDPQTRSIIQSRLDRVEQGNLGDCERLENGKGAWELRIHYGPGYRIYFGKVGKAIIILLCAGIKKDQRKDIERATTYWLDCKEAQWQPKKPKPDQNVH